MWFPLEFKFNSRAHSPVSKSTAYYGEGGLVPVGDIKPQMENKVFTAISEISESLLVLTPFIRAKGLRILTEGMISLSLFPCNTVLRSPVLKPPVLQKVIVRR
ncbi:hypothetical protein D8B26_006233 [Coccidioides posadasii str. Silveira]|uniref:uncharacterized protein n=1 Tax=Coccidioides posadasii (strain RMSCC 757 / Silveira) TaxID=443226 RepID=UPI001BEF68E7|nr:hypothetical protein D8B26_006233 [Coccidioides posadasii str. Silveira]